MIIRNRDVVVYNQANVNQWQQEINNLPAQIQQLRNLLNQKNSEIAPYQRALDHLNFQISMIESAINADGIDMVGGACLFADGVGGHRNYRGHIQHGIFDVAEGIIGAGLAYNGYNNLQEHAKQKAALENQRVIVQKKLNSLYSERNRISNTLAPLEKRYDFARMHIQPAKDFIRNFQQQPSLLVNQLANNIKQALENYNDQHPTNQNEWTRLTLKKIPKQIDDILSEQNTVDAYKYTLLCGLLQNCYDNISCQLPAILVACIKELLLNTHVGDYFFDVRMNANESINCRAAYELECLALHARQLEDFKKQESDELNEQLRRVRRLADSQNVLHQEVRNQCQVIEDFMKTNQQIDRKFFITVLENTRKILTSPMNSCEFSAALTKHTRLADYASGAPSLGRRIGGILLMVVGTAAMLGCAVALGVTGALPLIAGVCIGTTASLCGIGLFYSGTRRNLSQKMLAVTDGANKYSSQATAKLLRNGPPGGLDIGGVEDEVQGPADGKRRDVTNFTSLHWN